MENMRVFLSVLVAGLLSQNLVVPVLSNTLQDRKNYYGTPDPGTGGTSPPGGYGTPTPTHGTPPSPSSGGRGTPPSRGSGGYGTTPPSHGGSGGYNPTPSTPPTGNCGTPPPRTPTPSIPSNPPGGSGGGYYPSPPSSGGRTPPSPVVVSPPTTPYIDPGTPSTPVPPFLPAPSLPFIGTCNFWRTHPGVIWGLLGWWGTLGNAFGGVFPGGAATASMSFPEALSNTRNDGLGALYREGTASFLNSMVNAKFPFNTKQVRNRFIAGLGSNKAAVFEAHVFKLANEGHLKPRA